MTFQHLPEAGVLTLRTPFSYSDRMGLARAERRVLCDDATALGRVVVSVIGRPSEVTWWLDGEPQGGITATHAGVDLGIVPVEWGPLPVRLRDWNGQAELVTRGAPTRLAGRQRFLRVSDAGNVWTYHQVGGDGRGTGGGWRKVVGDVTGDRALRRGATPDDGTTVVTVRTLLKSEDPEQSEHGDSFGIRWEAGASVEEVALACMLVLSIDEIKLGPLLARAVFSLGGKA